MLPAAAEDAQSLFKEFSDSIYQIRIIDRSSGKQAGLGSGFSIDDSGLVVTNFHVIATYASQTSRYDIEFLMNDGTSGPLALLNIDVVNDLALLRLPQPAPRFIRLAAALPAQGESIYSIGNPHDLGWTVVPGTYNGITAHSVYERIHFSGSVNPGMSGGPVLNNAGEVIGVNVATAGNQLSFLIPLNRVAAFIDTAHAEPLTQQQVNEMVTAQLIANQDDVMNRVLAGTWGTTPFGQVEIPRELAPFIRCWGYTDDDPEIRYTHTATTCNSEEQIYLADDFNTGNIVYQFNWLESDELNSLQFYNMYEEKIANVYPDNDAEKVHVSEFQCHDAFVRGTSKAALPVVTKTTYCAREYRKYTGLYDVLFFGVSVHGERHALISHFTIAGIGPELAHTFLARFIESIQWN